MYPLCFELDEVEGMMHMCVADVIRVCEKTWEQRYNCYES
jgi:hypothetical protein